MIGAFYYSVYFSWTEGTPVSQLTHITVIWDPHDLDSGRIYANVPVKACINPGVFSLGDVFFSNLDDLPVSLITTVIRMTTTFCRYYDLDYRIECGTVTQLVKKN